MPMREMLFRAAALALCLFAAPAFAAMPDAAVTRAPAGDGKTLVRGRGVQGLCPPGWSGKEDDQWHGLRFTSADGKEYIMARALNFPMYDVPHYPLVMEWARGMGAKNVRSVEGLVEFTDKNGNKVVIAGYGADLPAVWKEYRDNPAAPDQGVGFSDMLGSIRADAETGARAEVPLHDGYAEDVSAEGDCWRVTAELAAFRAAPGAKARLWELLPKGSVLYKAEPAGEGQWIGAGEIDARGDGPAYVYRLYEGDRGYVRAADVQRAFCSAKRPRGEAAMSDAAFLELCAKGTAEQVMAALRQGAKVNVLVDLQEEDDMTPLMSAAVVGNLPVARALLAAGADVNAKNPFGLTALMFATRAEGGEAVARALLEAGADVNAKAENGLTALMEASRYGTSADVRAMLAAGADVNARAGDGRTALLHATMYNRDAAVVRALLEAGADKAPTDYEGHDALWHARKFKNGEIIRLLEGGAAKPAAMSDEAFVDLCREGTAEQVRQALRKGAKVNARFFPGEEDDLTPLTSAIRRGNLPVVRVLLAAGADVNAKSKTYGTTPLMWAAMHSDLAMVRTLLKAGAKVNAKGTEHGDTALKNAACHNKPEVVRALVEAGADVRARDGNGSTALHCAAQQNEYPETIGILVAAGADVNARCTDQGLTPLMQAAWLYSGEDKRIRNLTALLAAGADKSLKDKRGDDALRHARKLPERNEKEKAHKAEVIRLLEGGAAKPAANAPKPPTKYVGGIGPYPVTLFLDARARAGEKAGHYFYDHRPDSVFSLEMVKNEGDPEGFQEVILHEYTPRGMQSGVFTGRVATRGDGFSGAFVNSRGQSFPFELREAGD